jgi:hypothetical protein
LMAIANADGNVGYLFVKAKIPAAIAIVGWRTVQK